MHIAICMWGILRSLRFTIGSLRHYCLDPIINAGHTYEIFMHTYNFTGEYSNSRSGESNLHLDFDEWKMLNPDHITVENQDEFDSRANYTRYQTHGDPWDNGYISFINHIRALHSLDQLALQVEEASKTKKFDGVVYLRPDVTFLNELPFYLLEHFPDTLFLPDFHRSCEGGEYNDRMAMGNLASALTYGKKFEYALEYSLQGKLHSERFTYDHLIQQNIAVMEIPFRFKRTRATGKFHTRDETGIIDPEEQKNQHQHYDTPLPLRVVYTVLEEITNHKMYVWNHDDNTNLYCKPHPHLSIDECYKYKKLSMLQHGSERNHSSKYEHSERYHVPHKHG